MTRDEIIIAITNLSGDDDEVMEFCKKFQTIEDWILLIEVILEKRHYLNGYPVTYAILFMMKKLGEIK